MARLKRALKRVAKNALMLVSAFACAILLGIALRSTRGEPGRVSVQHQTPREPPSVSETPAARTQATCHGALKRAGVAFRVIARGQAEGVAWPIMITGPVGGVRIIGAKSPEWNNYLDCKLALTLLAWAPYLREQDVVSVEHYSLYRQDATVAGTRKPSGHASGLAFDLASVELRDGRKLSVLTDWTNRKRGSEPCTKDARDGDAGRRLRQLVCDAVERQLFQTVITPHYNDAHKNHVHLEIGPPDQGFVH